ncbi:CHASE domain-containing protein [Burkholderiaceae bacterium UC74_6]
MSGRLLWVLLALVVAYVLLGLLGLSITVSPRFASPFFPAAGLGLAIAITWGWRGLPAIFVGAALVNAWLLRHMGEPLNWTPLAIACFGSLQAWVGAVLVQRFCARPLLLNSLRELLNFVLWGALISTLISSGLSTAALYFSGELLPGAVWDNLLSWWVGDACGVLVATPMALTIFGRPRKTWAPRRVTVGLPLLLCCALMGAATVAVMQWDLQRSRNLFERDALNATEQLETRLREVRLALEAVRSMTLATPELGRKEFERGAAAFLTEGSALRALGVAMPVARKDVAAFDRAAQAEGLTRYHASDRKLPGDVEPPEGEEMMAIRLIEPLASNSGALGVNVRSVAASRTALMRALTAGEARSTTRLQLSQDKKGVIGVVVYAPVYAGQPTTAEERRASVRAVAFATIRPDAALDRVMRSSAPELQLCMLDEDGGRLDRLAGPVGCEAPPGPQVLVRERRIDLAGREWLLRATAPVSSYGSDSTALPFAVVGLLATGLLGMMLLLVSGRAQFVEALVDLRTTALEREMAERVEAAHALGMSEQRFSTIFADAPVGIAFSSVNGFIEDANPQVCRMLDRSLEELRELRMADLVHPDQLPEMRRVADQLLEGRAATVHHQMRVQTRQGREVDIRVQVRLLHDAAGQPLRFLSVVEDITDELRMQELVQARQTAELANQAKTDFLSRMSHELRTPLNAMLGFVQLMEIDPQEPLGQRQFSRAVQIQQAGWHLLAMINDMLDLSRIEAGVLAVQPENLDLPQLVGEALALVEVPARERGVAIQLELGPEARWIHADRTRVKQVLTNLLSNAVKYNRPQGQVRVRSRLAEGRVELAVHDTGLGMSAQQMEHLFQPFNRLGRERSQTEGTGIGLVIARRLAELMGGELHATSTEGEGSVFTLTLPAGRPHGSASEERAAAAPGSPLPPRRIVYIEDNAVNAAVMRGIIEQRPGLELQVCATGQAGLAALADRLPDLLLLDVQLPDLNGLEVLRRLRQRWSAETLPVIVVSADALPEQADTSNELGALAYLTKPVDVAAMLALLDQTLMRAPVKA